MLKERLRRQVKIVCTLGPASRDLATIEKMLTAGMDVARLNFNYGTRVEHQEMIRNVRAASKNLGLATAILVDLPGLKKHPDAGIKQAFGPDLEFVQQQDIDYVALSFISHAGQVAEVRKILKTLRYEIPLIIKIEKAPALENSEAIMQAADGIMVARGDLAIQINIEKVPLAQKRLIRAANRRGIPVITATEMLESMVRSVSPTRAEATDVANAVLDGSDALMLSEESAMGKYPVAAVETMAKIALEAQTGYPHDDLYLRAQSASLPEINDATARAACQIADQLSARAIIAFTTGGATAIRVSKYRPHQPIIAVTPSDEVMRRLALVWGVHPEKQAQYQTLDDLFELSGSVARESGVAKPGESIVVTAGLPLMVSGSTNLVKVHVV